MTSRHKQVRIAIVIQIHNPGAPADVASLDSQPRGCCLVNEVSLSVVAVENVPVIGKMRLEDIEVPVQIVVTHSNAHAGLRHPVVVQGNATQDALFAKGSIV